MAEKISNIINEMIKYYAKDPRRVNHFLKVYSFAKAILSAILSIFFK